MHFICTFLNNDIVSHSGFNYELFTSFVRQKAVTCNGSRRVSQICVSALKSRCISPHVKFTKAASRGFFSAGGGSLDASARRPCSARALQAPFLQIRQNLQRTATLILQVIRRHFATAIGETSRFD